MAEQQKWCLEVRQSPEGSLEQKPEVDQLLQELPEDHYRGCPAEGSGGWRLRYPGGHQKWWPKVGATWRLGVVAGGWRWWGGKWKLVFDELFPFLSFPKTTFILVSTKFVLLPFSQFFSVNKNITKHHQINQNSIIWNIHDSCLRFKSQSQFNFQTDVQTEVEI